MQRAETAPKLTEEGQQLRFTRIYKALQAAVFTQDRKRGEGAGLADAVAVMMHITDDQGRDFFEVCAMARAQYLNQIDLTRGAK